MFSRPTYVDKTKYATDIQHKKPECGSYHDASIAACNKHNPQEAEAAEAAKAAA